ncbi:MAG: hypothetical protein AB1450_02365 [Pseudomonadota bacterium]
MSFVRSVRAFLAFPWIETHFCDVTRRVGGAEFPMHRLVVTALLLAAMLPARAEQVLVTFGSEYFSWREYDGGVRWPEEAGLRHFVGLKTDSAPAGNWHYGLHSRIYPRRVAHDGAPLRGAPTGSNDSGWSAELDFTRAFPAALGSDDEPVWGIKLGIGYDSRRRESVAAYSPYRGQAVYGYAEDYQVGYGRLGAVYSGGAGWEVQGGVKLPFYTGDSAGPPRAGYDSDPGLKPKPDYSLYAAVSYRLNGSWDLGGYYDSYRFRQSDSSPVTEDGSLYNIYQPRSQQDSIGFYLNYRF